VPVLDHDGRQPDLRAGLLRGFRTSCACRPLKGHGGSPRRCTSSCSFFDLRLPARPAADCAEAPSGPVLPETAHPADVPPRHRPPHRRRRRPPLALAFCAFRHAHSTPRPQPSRTGSTSARRLTVLGRPRHSDFAVSAAMAGKCAELPRWRGMRVDRVYFMTELQITTRTPQACPQSADTRACSGHGLRRFRRARIFRGTCRWAMVRPPLACREYAYTPTPTGADDGP